MADTTRAFVTGYPIGHSRSPLIHQYWLAHYAIAGKYEPVETTADALAGFLSSLARHGFCGGNITLPHKEQAYQLVDVCDEVARHIGAVNTVWLENGTLHGSNTDAYGFASNLDDFAPGWEQDSALVLGAGGASRAVIYALLRRGINKIFVVNRTRAKAERLAGYFGRALAVADWHDINTIIKQTALIINTTSLGMERHPEQSPAGSTIPFIDFGRARQDALVTDIVYTPPVTPFLAAAQKAGLNTVDAVGMLLHQAVPGFERWFGIKPKVTQELRSVILASMGNKAADKSGDKAP